MSGEGFCFFFQLSVTIHMFILFEDHIIEMKTIIIPSAHLFLKSNWK